MRLSTALSAVSTALIVAQFVPRCFKGLRGHCLGKLEIYAKDMHRILGCEILTVLIKFADDTDEPREAAQTLVVKT